MKKNKKKHKHKEEPLFKHDRVYVPSYNVSLSLFVFSLVLVAAVFGALYAADKVQPVNDDFNLSDLVSTEGAAPVVPVEKDELAKIEVSLRNQLIAFTGIYILVGLVIIFPVFKPVVQLRFYLWLFFACFFLTSYVSAARIIKDHERYEEFSNELKNAAWAVSVFNMFWLFAIWYFAGGYTVREVLGAMMFWKDGEAEIDFFGQVHAGPPLFYDFVNYSQSMFEPEMAQFGLLNKNVKNELVILYRSQEEQLEAGKRIIDEMKENGQKTLNIVVESDLPSGYKNVMRSINLDHLPPSEKFDPKNASFTEKHLIMWGMAPFLEKYAAQQGIKVNIYRSHTSTDIVQFLKSQLSVANLVFGREYDKEAVFGLREKLALRKLRNLIRMGGKRERYILQYGLLHKFEDYSTENIPITRRTGKPKNYPEYF